MKGKPKRLQSPLLHEQSETRCQTKNCSRPWQVQLGGQTLLLCSFCASHKVSTEDDKKKKKHSQ